MATPLDPRALAHALRARSDDELAQLFALRGVPEQPGWQDFFDAAEALSSPESVTRALAALPADALHALAAAGAEPVTEKHRESLRARLLVDEHDRRRPEVTDPVAALAPVAAGNGGAPAPSADSASEAAAAERAHTGIDALGELLLATLHHPAALVASGALGAAERRRLSARLTTPDDLEALLGLARGADLLTVEGRQLLPTTSGAAWLQRDAPSRWAAVTRAWLTRLPPALRTDHGWRDPDEWGTAFPADPSWPKRAQSLLSQAEVWGLIASGGREPAWATAIREGRDPLPALADALPHDVDRIYLQHDLTAIAPGPLVASADVRLRSMARRESHAHASTYRFTTETVSAALTDGEDAESILAFLAEIALTGVPQPIEYLVRETAARFGQVQVDVDGDHTRVRASDPGVLATIEVDQTLRPLGLIRRNDSLWSRADRDTVVWALVDARYPAIALDADGAPERVRRSPLAQAPAADAAPAQRYGALIATLRNADGADADAAWLDRELAVAVRMRALLSIEVELPGGERRTFTVEATGMSGGRLRARERGTDVERTLPVASIRSVSHLVA